jgi:hypothetical protein
MMITIRKEGKWAENQFVLSFHIMMGLSVSWCAVSYRLHIKTCQVKLKFPEPLLCHAEQLST